MQENTKPNVNTVSISFLALASMRLVGEIADMVYYGEVHVILGIGGIYITVLQFDIFLQRMYSMWCR